MAESATVEVPGAGTERGVIAYFADRAANRSRFYFGTWWEWWQRNQALGQSGWTGEHSPAEALEACQAWGIKHFADYQGLGGRKPFVSSPVYP